MARTKPYTHSSTKHAEHQDANDIQNIFFPDLSIYLYLFIISKSFFQDMLSYRLKFLKYYYTESKL